MEIAACVESHARLDQTLRRLEPDASGTPSLLPGWTVAHVLAHLALNGASVVRRLEAAVDRAFADLPEATWDQPVLDGGGRQVPAAHLAFARWREVETHHVDLGVGYTAAQWPQALVDRWLPGLLEGLSHRSDQRTLMAWALGRGPAPELENWG